MKKRILAGLFSATLLFGTTGAPLTVTADTVSDSFVNTLDDEDKPEWPEEPTDPNEPTNPSEP
ncbi:MAG: cell surface protein, partial [Tetragenococcus koreensis]|nr:cell surface protein [Tetragenococcus koreensis]MDN6146053.1 cell surface protein [Tetragenococcus koreensis]MDN6541884.1 cell surface protein [Tetragenococcus koreensis]MDN6579973.1 cell surface protein [Tetragenococcus koreensis]MDN6749105.1 cell surface protein [Staphylococcus equorum]